jgi:hypothetical protein
MSAEQTIVPANARHTLRIEQQLITLQGFLESRRHEGIAWSRVDENLEVDPEEDEVQDERKDDQSQRSVRKVTIEVCLSWSATISCLCDS